MGTCRFCRGPGGRRRSPLGLGFEDGVAWQSPKPGVWGKVPPVLHLLSPRNVTCTQPAVRAPGLARLCTQTSVLPSCPTLCNPTDCRPPDSSVHGILQVRTLEWVAYPPPRNLPNPGMERGPPALQEDSLPAEPPGKPQGLCTCCSLAGTLSCPPRPISSMVLRSLPSHHHRQQDGSLPQAPSFPGLSLCYSRGQSCTCILLWGPDL